MKNLLKKFVLTAALISVSSINAFASINSAYEITPKIDSLRQLGNYNLNGMINRSDLVGERLQNFNLITAQYQNSILVTQESLSGIVSQISILNNSSNISDMEKNMQIRKLLKEADTALYNIDSKTIQYLYSVRTVMPTLTYQKYSKRFRELYNSLRISDSKLISK